MTENRVTTLTLGDSYTIGTGAPPADRWPAQLTRALREEGFSLAEPVYVAKNGWTSADLLHALKDEPLAGPFDTVTLLIGVNDQYDGVPPETYRHQLGNLLEKSIQLAGGEPGRVLCLSIPDWSVTPFAADRDREEIRREIEHFNRIFWEQVQSRGTAYVNLTPLSRQAGENGALLVEDGLHPSGCMYALWVEAILPAAREIFDEHR